MPYGRILFGASAVLFGVVSLMWHDAQTWQSVSRIWRMPFGTTIGNALMVAQIAGGIALVYPRTARVASIILAIVYAIFSLTCIPGIIKAPKIFGEYDSFFEQFSLFCGAIAVYAPTFARIGLGVSTVSFTLAQIVYLRLTADLVPTWIPPNQMFWAIVTTIAFALAAIAMPSTVRPYLQCA